MKTKVILSALAASTMFAACTNDELDNIKVQDAPKAEWVALEGLEANVQVEGLVDSRLTTDGQWEATDEVGVGFINWWTGSGLGSYSEGTRHSGTGWANEVSSHKLYANHRLYQNEGSWKFETVVYEGLHFAYYPLQAHTSVAPLVVELGKEQTYGEEDALITEGLFAITPLYDLAKDAAGKAPKASFGLNTVSNRLNLNFELADAKGITDPIIIKSVSVKAIDNTNPTPAVAKIFAQKATINAASLPTADYTNLLAWEILADNDDNKTASKKAEAIAADEAETAERFAEDFIDNEVINVAPEDQLSTLTTTIKNHGGLKDGNNTYAVNLISYPSSNLPAIDKLKIQVEVETNYGLVTISTKDELGTAAEKAIIKHNNEKLAALANILEGDASNAPKVDNKPIIFTGFGKYASTTLKIDMKDAELNSVSASNAKEWADAVKIAGQKSVQTIYVNGNIAVDLTELPEAVNTINVAEDMTLTISGNIADPTLQITGDGEVVVAASTALTVNGTIAKPAKLTIGTEVNNYGEMTVGENGTLILSAVATNHGVINNNNKLTVATFTNEKDIETVSTAHTCEGIVKNYATLTVNTIFTNQGTYYTIGANSVLDLAEITAGTYATMNNTGVAITENGGSFENITGGAKKATVNTPAQMELAINKATEITVTGMVSLDTEVTLANTKIILADNAELYLLENAKLGATAAASNIKKIEVAGTNTKISSVNPQYVFEVVVNAGKDLTILEGTKLGVDKFAYEINSTVTNNGFGVIVATPGDTRGTWTGLAWNKKIVSGQEQPLTSF